MPCSIGRGGLTDQKSEGDGATPRGCHAIVGILFRADRMRSPTPKARPISFRDLWSDDSRDPHYNSLVKAPHPFQCERLYRGDRIYDLILVLDWNYFDPIKGDGSAIFLHQWRRPRYPTAGCVALRSDHLLWIARRINEASRLIVL